MSYPLLNSRISANYDKGLGISFYVTLVILDICTQINFKPFFRIRNPLFHKLKTTHFLFKTGSNRMFKGYRCATTYNQFNFGKAL